MSLIVIMPGGFHPFHAGHYSLYSDAKKAFPNADLYVAATNDQSERPFPFALKEKLAKLAGVEHGKFIQVKSPFQAKEITQHYNPEQDVLVFVRSEKDRNEQPKPGGTKKDGSPAYFQPWTGKNLQPFSKHAYIHYLPTVEFGPGITSATQIRKAWPTLNDKRKLALVMSLYPAAQKNLKLAQNVVGMFDQVMGGQVTESLQLEEGLGDYITKKIDDFLDTPKVSPQQVSRLMRQAPKELPDDVAEKLVAKFMETEKAKRLAQQAAEANKTTVEKIVPYLTYFGRMFVDRWKQIPQRDRDNALKNLVHNIGRFLLFILEILLKGIVKKESIQKEKKDDLFISGDPESEKLLRFAQQHYPTASSKQQAFVKFVQRALKHSEEEDNEHDAEISQINQEIDKIKKVVNNLQVSENKDYLDEK